MAVRSSQIINIPIKGFTAKKSAVLNDDEPRPVPIPKDFAHLIICKFYEAYIEFIQRRSAALVEMSDVKSKCQMSSRRNVKAIDKVDFQGY